MDMIQDIDDFHKKFGFTPRPNGEKPDQAFTAFRLKFLAEELHEILVATGKDDLENVLDGLVDLVYVAIGTAWLLNLDFKNAWERVQTANMAKVRAERAEDSKRGSTFDVIKPKGWTKPDIASLISPEDRALKHTKPTQAKGEQLSLFGYFKELEEGEKS